MRLALTGALSEGARAWRMKKESSAEPATRMGRSLADLEQKQVIIVQHERIVGGLDAGGMDARRHGRDGEHQIVAAVRAEIDRAAHNLAVIDVESHGGLLGRAGVANGHQQLRRGIGHDERRLHLDGDRSGIHRVPCAEQAGEERGCSCPRAAGPKRRGRASVRAGGRGVAGDAPEADLPAGRKPSQALLWPSVTMKTSRSLARVLDGVERGKGGVAEARGGEAEVLRLDGGERRSPGRWSVRRSAARRYRRRGKWRHGRLC